MLWLRRAGSESDIPASHISPTQALVGHIPGTFRLGKYPDAKCAGLQLKRSPTAQNKSLVFSVETPFSPFHLSESLNEVHSAADEQETHHVSTHHHRGGGCTASICDLLQFFDRQRESMTFTLCTKHRRPAPPADPT